MAKTVTSVDPNACIRDNTPAMDRHRDAAGPHATVPQSSFRPSRFRDAPQPPAPSMSDDMRDGDNDGPLGRSSYGMPGMPGPLPGGR